MFEGNIRSEGIIKIDAEGLHFLYILFILLGRKPSSRRAPSNFISGRTLALGATTSIFHECAPRAFCRGNSLIIARAPCNLSFVAELVFRWNPILQNCQTITHSRRFIDSTIAVIDIVITVYYIANKNLICTNLITKQFPRQATISAQIYMRTKLKFINKYGGLIMDAGRNFQFDFGAFYLSVRGKMNVIVVNSKTDAFVTYLSARWKKKNRHIGKEYLNASRYYSRAKWLRRKKEKRMVTILNIKFQQSWVCETRLKSNTIIINFTAIP